MGLHQKTHKSVLGNTSSLDLPIPTCFNISSYVGYVKDFYKSAVKCFRNPASFSFRALQLYTKNFHASIKIKLLAFSKHDTVIAFLSAFDHSNWEHTPQVTLLTHVSILESRFLSSSANQALFCVLWRYTNTPFRKTQARSTSPCNHGTKIPGPLLRHPYHQQQSLLLIHTDLQSTR